MTDTVAVLRFVAAVMRVIDVGLGASIATRRPSMAGISDGGLSIDAFRSDSRVDSDVAKKSLNASVGFGGRFSLNQCAAVRPTRYAPERSATKTRSRESRLSIASSAIALAELCCFVAASKKDRRADLFVV